jgi:hypothetical protein
MSTYTVVLSLELEISRRHLGYKAKFVGFSNRVLLVFGTHGVRATGEHHFLPFFFALTPTESGDCITKCIDVAIAQLLKFTGVRIRAHVAIIDRSLAMKNGACDSTLFDERLAIIITCFEHLLFAGKIPGSKAVQDTVKDILRALHTCTTVKMVQAVLNAEVTPTIRADAAFADALVWLNNLVADWDFYLTSGGIAGIMPSAQVLESFNKTMKTIVSRLNMKLNEFWFSAVPDLLAAFAGSNTERVVAVRSPIGLQYVVRVGTVLRGPGSRSYVLICAYMCSYVLICAHMCLYVLICAYMCHVQPT